MCCYQKVFCFDEISDDDMKLILNTRLPCAIRRSGIVCSDPNDYQIIDMTLIKEPRGDIDAYFICIEITADFGNTKHKYYFRVYPNNLERSN